MAQKPSIPKGTRDFSPTEVAKRQYIIQIIKSNFEKFGYQPIETPSFENSETLMGKYGEEGDRLIFKILNSGDYLGKVDATLLENRESNKLTSSISEKALRYDLTVPFARYVVQHQNDIEFPFKRYQIQPVWRADRPQKGRFREFYQCDADVVGSTSLWQEVELVQLYDAVFNELGLEGVTIKINNRKILSGIAEVIGASDKLIDFTVALDKLDKIGEDGVKTEMIEKGISAEAIAKVQPLFTFTGTISEKIEKLSQLLASSEEGMKGVAEILFICDNVINLGLNKSILDLDVTLARGLNYYTGAIFEVAPPKSVSMGSIGGGGRYDDLTGIFGLKNMSGVGISFGLDRIYMVIEELELFPETVTSTSKALFINYGEKEAFYSMKAIKELRNHGIKVELYPDNVKVGKQFQHADKRGIPFAVVVGGEEMEKNQYALKDLVSGEQKNVSLEELIQNLK
ncbi:histidine--tRNA ligase [Flavobacterium sp. GT3R68]|uniref:histidine--tRNA ligase n=1 Tax=Flavobacterium sp. GT3R68 TaxID=2594437 RepID=UPI000F88D5CC|nr:histidine--tRNA ligase [Flavobacterium sp. GT3R68]RTY88575.1 histidine--tRNA ligase [Flavobacterium sp. GSN2]TRW90608.1 histidine--tRNA ligase [Flavobacterium sp. GT3R68]